MSTLARLTLLIGLSLLTTHRVTAESPEEKGLRIFQEADARNAGYGGWTASLKMVLRNQNGDVSERSLHIRGLENPDPNDGDKTLVIFDLPPDVKGTALLSHTHIADADDQWLFLPALERVKRITSSNKSGPFMGSEFAYEDFTAQEVAKYTYKWLRDEPCGDLSCWVIERDPRYEHSGYSRQIAWVDQAEYRAQKVEYYDRNERLLKTLTLSDYTHHLDRFWRAHRLAMLNNQNGKSTELTWSDYQLKLPLSDQDFTETALRRAH